jgi:Tfp pilus assembly protein PilF
MDDKNLIPNEGIQLCKEILDKSDVKDDKELQFYFHTKLSNYYFNNGEYHNAISALRVAISIKPNNFIANMRLAELYERVGFVDDAILHYEAALSNSEIISSELREFVNSQIQL